MGEQEYSAESVSIGTSNLLEILPTEIWVVVLGAALAALGWFGKTAYDSFQKSRLPFKEDKNRWDKLIDSLNTESIYYFTLEPQWHGIPWTLFKELETWRNNAKLNPVSVFVNQKLAKLESELICAVDNYLDVTSDELIPSEKYENRLTVFMPSLPKNHPRQTKEFKKSKENIEQATKRVVLAFEAFRDFGFKHLSVKYGKVDSDA